MADTQTLLRVLANGAKPMTEEQWLSCTNPALMLEFIQGRACDRCLRLFAVACCRRLWRLLTDLRSRTAVEVAERDADELFSEMDLVEAWEQAIMVPSRLRKPAKRWAAEAASGSAWWGELSVSPKSAGQHAAEATAERAALAAEAAEGSSSTERAGQASLLRCIFGNPFRPLSLDPSWLTWNDGTIKRLAENTYEQRVMPAGTFDNARLAVLADALEEAGCTRAELLGHLRRPGPHVRGCFVLDLLLSKE